MTEHSDTTVVVLLPTLILTVVGASTFNILPLLAMGAARNLQFSDRQIGVMSSAMLVGSSASALFAGLWIRSVTWPRAARYGLGGMFGAAFLLLFVHRYWLFVMLLGASGFFATAAFCLGMSILADRPEAERGIGMAFAMQVAYQIAVFLSGPILVQKAGLKGVIAILLASSGLTMALTPLLPTNRTMGLAQPPNQRAFFTLPTTVALLGFGAFSVGVGAFWTYAELIGQSRGMTPHAIADGISIGLLGGLFGAGLAGLFGGRLGKMAPLCLAMLMTFAASLLLNTWISAAAFFASNVLFLFAWNYAPAYQFAIANSVDRTGRAVAVAPAFGFLGAAAGASLSALLLAPGDYRLPIWLVAATASLSTALFALALVIDGRATSRMRLRRA